MNASSKRRLLSNPQLSNRCFRFRLSSRHRDLLYAFSDDGKLKKALIERLILEDMRELRSGRVLPHDLFVYRSMHTAKAGEKREEFVVSEDVAEVIEYRRRQLHLLNSEYVALLLERYNERVMIAQRLEHDYRNLRGFRAT